jgi:hypothetical protein
MNALQSKIQDLHQYSASITAEEDLFNFWEQTKQAFYAEAINGVEKNKKPERISL